MSTRPREGLDFEEQRVRIVRAIEEAEKFLSERRKLDAERDKLQGELRFQPWAILFQGTLAAAALMGAGAAFAKLFLS